MSKSFTLVAALAACGGDASTPTGTLVYAERDTANIRVLDLASGDDQLIDSGQFGSVSIAPDAAHVAYEGADEQLEIADRAGGITAFPGGGCAGPGVWITRDVLWYCTADASMLVASPTASARKLDVDSFAISADGSTVAAADRAGNLTLEAVDGSQHRVLVPSPNGRQPLLVVLDVTPDRVLVLDESAFPSHLKIVSTSDGTSIDVADATTMGTPFGPSRFLGASPYSPDGSELLLQSTKGVIAVNVATGATRVVATFSSGESAGGAGFVDADRVAWVAVEDHSQGDIGMFSLSLHLASGTDDTVLAHSSQENIAWPTIAVTAAGLVAVPNGSATSTTQDLLGLTADGRGVITLATTGEVSLVDVEGAITHLANVGAPSNAGLIGPFAAYTSGP